MNNQEQNQNQENHKENNQNQTKETNDIDTGLSCLIIISQFHQISIDQNQIKHTFAINDKINSIDIIRAAKQIGLKAKITNIQDYNKIKQMVMPAIAKLKDNTYIIIAQINQDKLLILDPKQNAPKLITKEEFIQIYQGELLLFTKRYFSKNSTEFGLRWFIPDIIKYKAPLIQVLIAALTMQILGLFTPMIMQVVIDKVLVHNSITTLNVLIIGLMIITIFETLMNIARNYVFTHTTSRIDVMLGARLFKHLFSLPFRYFETRRVGDTIARVRELENIRQFLTGAPLTSLLDLMFIIVYITVMFFYSKQLTTITLISLPIFMAISLIITPIFKARLEERFKFGAMQQSYLVETITGVQTIKSFALEPQIQRKWEDLISNYIKSSFKTSILAGNASAIAQFVQKTFDIIILWVGAQLVINHKISVGQLIAFRMLSSRVSTPVLRLVQMWQDFQQTSLSIKRLGDIFNTKEEPSIDPSKIRLPQIKGQIQFHKVRFRYDIQTSEVIRDMSFTIKQGEIIGIVGRSGSGKSTISKLIQRLYIPQAGKILIDEVDIALADPAWLRRQIGVVLQENFLFNATIRENISIHNPSASIEQIIQMAKIAGAHEFILQLPNAYDTMVGENGTGLSGGQKQRIAIARALLTNPRILIFDEATSALDYESESIIQKNLKQISKGRTLIIIAHRLSTLKDAHKIMAIDKGSLIEYGTKQELLQAKGLYYYLHSQQETGDIC